MLDAVGIVFVHEASGSMGLLQEARQIWHISSMISKQANASILRSAAVE